MKVSWRLKRVEVVQRRTVLYSHEEKNTRVWSAKESLPKVKIEQEREGSCGSAKEEVRGRVKRGRMLVVGSRVDRSANDTCAGASRTADAGLKVDHCSKTRMVL